jgi:hypothetical protein
MHNKKQILKDALKFDELKSLDKETFLNAWKAIAFLNPGLHPDEYQNPDGGWPEELKVFAEEAFRRSEAGELADDELYCYEQAMKGLDAKENMKVNLNKIEIIEANSDETLCFSAHLYINGVFVATVHNNGQGEANRYYFKDKRIRDEFFSYCRNLPDFDSPYGPLTADEDLVIGDLIAKKLS